MFYQGWSYGLDTVKSVKWVLYKNTRHVDVTLQQAAGTDISKYVSRSTQSAEEAQLTLNWHLEIYSESLQPMIGDIVELFLENKNYWIGVVREINDYRLSSGSKSLQVVARTRDSGSAWREVKRTTPLYTAATPATYIARNIARSVGLSDAEIDLPEVGLRTIHSNIQMADLSAFQMLETLYVAAGYEPYVNARGVLKLVSRDVRRDADITLDDNRRLVEVTGSKSRTQITEVCVKWLDPNLSEVAQQTSCLGQCNITAGFFQLRQEQDIWFSDDHTQRARDTYMIVKQSANSGLIPVCTEDYKQLSMVVGRITLHTHAWVPLLATASIAAKVAASFIGDAVFSFGAGMTVPVGRLIECAADVVLFLTMMSIGTGSYEVWGTPFDYAHARNSTTAYNPNANIEEINIKEIENDFVMGQLESEAMAIRELMYEYRSASSYNVVIVDDTRIERGDIVKLKDGSKIYVTSYSRDVSPGATAILSVSGFRV